MAEGLGRNDPVLEGTVLERASADVLIDVPVATRQIGFRYEPMGQRVRVDFGEILEMERRELDQWKTTGLIAGLGTVVGVIAWQVFGGESGGGTNDPGGGDVSDAKILRIDLRIGR